MRTLGLVAAKHNSNRFPGKNYYDLNGEPMFLHSVTPLLESNLVDDVYVITDSDVIKSHCDGRGISVIHRPKNATRDEDKLISILRYGYYTLDIEYDTIVSVMANCPGNTVNDIDSAIGLLKNNNLKEVRGFGPDGLENGLMVLDKEILQTNRDISYYVGGIITHGTEIHYKEDL